jgi:hypothetical protein
MTYEEIISSTANSLGLSKDFVDKTYRAYWKAVREHIIALPLKQDLSEDEFLRIQPNVNIPSIGKLYITLDRYKGIKAKNKEIIEKYGTTH